MEVIREVEPERDLQEYIRTEKSGFGRGGMMTKCSIALKVADEGIEVIIANGKRDDVLTDLVLRPGSRVCTRFAPREGNVSSVKKWIAHSDGFAKGEIRINQGAYDALMSSQASSLLPVGVVAVDGDFEKDDIVRVLAPDGRQFAVGRTSYDSDEARAAIGKQGLRPVIHYNYLYIEQL